jgi:hypothetical protein
MISNYKFQVVLGEHYGMSLDFKAKMKNEWKNVSNRKCPSEQCMHKANLVSEQLHEEVCKVYYE